MNLIEETCNGLEIGDELKGLYDALTSVLQQEVVLYRELTEAFSREREVLTHYSPDELSESNSRKETAILKAKMLGEARTKLVGKISRSIGLAERDCDMSALISHAGAYQRQTLRELQKTLSSLFKEMQEMNERNKILLDSSIFYVQQSIDFIAHLTTPSSVYGMSGELRAGGPVGRILCRKG